MADLSVLTPEEVQAAHEAWEQARRESGRSKTLSGEGGNVFFGDDDDFWDTLDALAVAKAGG